MQDVAGQAGVSIKTVSRVVNGEAYVAPETAARVRAAIGELGFRRNEMAHLLRKQNATAAIGLVIEDLGNPFYAAIARAAEQVAREHDCVLVVGSSEQDPARERELIASLLRRRVDGLLLVPAAQDHEFLRAELERGVPIVCLDRPAAGIDADVVLLDNFRGAEEAVEHLLEQGHRRIAMLSDDSSVWTGAERLRGYRAALHRYRVRPDEALVAEGCFDVTDSADAATRLLAQRSPPTAFFAANNRGSIGALLALGRSQRRAAIVGFDDFELAELLTPPVTVVSYEASEMGRAAARLLFERMRGEAGAPRTLTIPVHLVRRSEEETSRWE